MLKTYIFDGATFYGTGKLSCLHNIPKENNHVFFQEEYITPLLSVKIKPLCVQGLYSFELRESTLKNALYQLQYALTFYKVDFFMNHKYTCLTDDGKKSIRTIKDFSKYLVVRRFSDESYT